MCKKESRQIYDRVELHVLKGNLPKIIISVHSYGYVVIKFNDTLWILDNIAYVMVVHVWRH